MEQIQKQQTRSKKDNVRRTIESPKNVYTLDLSRMHKYDTPLSI